MAPVVADRDVCFPAAPLALLIALGLGCARMTLHTPPADPRAAMAAVRFEAPLHEGEVSVTAVGSDGVVRVCAPPCDLPMRVGRSEVAVRGGVRLVQPIEVPREGARYALVDPARSRRHGGIAGIIVSGLAVATGIIGIYVSGMDAIFAESFCPDRRDPGTCPSLDAARGRVVAFGITTAVGAVAVVASALIGFTGPRVHLERLPDVDIGVAPVPGGAVAGLTIRP